MRTSVAASLVLIGFLTGCGRSHRSISGLQPSEQIQAIVLDHVASEFFRQPSSGPDGYRLFLAIAREPYADAPQPVFEYVAASFRSARPVSAASHDFTVVERGTGRDGAILWVEPFSISGDGPMSIKAGYFVDGRNGEVYEYRVHRIKGRWTILERKLLRVF